MHSYEEIFDALAEPVRRELLDRLLRRDGATTGELACELGMTRAGVLRHLNRLDAAGLVEWVSRGRERQWLLRPGPVAAVHEGWTSRFYRRWCAEVGRVGPSRRRRLAEDQGERHVQVSYIRCAPDRVWAALTSPEVTELLLPSSRVGHEGDGLRVMSAWIPGAGIHFTGGDGTLEVAGVLLECDPPHLLSFTWQPALPVSRRAAARAGLGAMRQPVGFTGLGTRPSVVTARMEDLQGLCRVTIEHEFPVAAGFGRRRSRYEEMGASWRVVLDSLKSLLETGRGFRGVPGRSEVRRRIEAEAGRGTSPPSPLSSFEVRGDRKRAGRSGG